MIGQGGGEGDQWVDRRPAEEVSNGGGWRQTFATESADYRYDCALADRQDKSQSGGNEDREDSAGGDEAVQAFAADEGFDDTANKRTEEHEGGGLEHDGAEDDGEGLDRLLPVVQDQQQISATDEEQAQNERYATSGFYRLCGLTGTHDYSGASSLGIRVTPLLESSIRQRNGLC